MAREKLVERGRRVGEGAASKIPHERLHRPPLVAKEVVRLGQHQGRNIVVRARSMALPEQTVVRRARDKIVEQCASVARIDAAVLPATSEQLALVAALGQLAGRCPHSSAWDAERYCSSTRARCCRMNSERETPRSRAARESSQSSSGSSAMVVAFFLESAMKVI